MTLDFHASLEARGFDLELTVGDAETVAVLGPNGAGKSTLLNLIAGLIRPDAGRAVLGDRVLFDLGAPAQGNRPRRGRWLPPHRRSVSLLAQDALLFPHLTALDNVAFGPRSAGVGRLEADRRAHDWLGRVDAATLADRKPAHLSGGQAQRIAIARALASDPALLLLDEPMAALDVSVAPALRRMLRDVLAERAAVIVTHDVLDAYTLADRVIVLQDGKIVDVGPTRDVLDRPTTSFAADLTGLNLLLGAAQDTSGKGALAEVLLDSGHRVDARFAEPVPGGERVGVSVRPSLVAIARQEPARSEDCTVIRGTVSDLEQRRDVIRVHCGELAADLPPAEAADLDLAPGTAVWLAFPSEHAVAYRV